MRSFLSLVLALLVLAGSAGVTVSRHFCQGELQAFALFGQAERCSPAEAVKQCPFHGSDHPDGESVHRKGCCDDDELVLQIDVQKEAEAAPAPPAIVATVPDFPPLLFSYSAPHPRPCLIRNFRNYRPPPLLTDATREYQVFRI